MTGWTETTLNADCNKFWFVRIGKENKHRAIAFTTTQEDAERIVKALLGPEDRAVIEEYDHSDLTVIIEKKGRGK